MKVKVEEWEVLGEDMDGDPHIACSLLKLWLREMAEPLFPTDFTPEVRKNFKPGSKVVAQSRSMLIERCRVRKIIYPSGSGP